MTIKQAQIDRNTALNVIGNLRGTLANFKIFFGELDRLKTDIFADQQRKDAVIAYFTNCDCDYEWSDVVTQYQEFKTIYDYLGE